MLAGFSVECDLSMRASKVVRMIFLEEEGNIVDLEVEVQCIDEVDRVRIMDRKTVKFMTDKGPSSNTMGDIPLGHQFAANSNGCSPIRRSPVCRARSPAGSSNVHRFATGCSPVFCSAYTRSFIPIPSVFVSGF